MVRLAAVLCLAPLPLVSSTYCTAVPTAAAFNCPSRTLPDGTVMMRTGLVCPSDAPTCTGTTAAGANCAAAFAAAAAQTASDCPVNCVFTPAEVGAAGSGATWADNAVEAWAGYDMAACSGATETARRTDVVRRCDGVNDCGDGGQCRATVAAGGGYTISCSSDEMGCGGLVDQLTAGSVIGISSDGTAAPEEFGVDAAGALVTAMGNSISLSVSPTMQSGWMVPYASQLAARAGQASALYSYADRTTYAEIADTEVRRIALRCRSAGVRFDRTVVLTTCFCSFCSFCSCCAGGHRHRHRRLYIHTGPRPEHFHYVHPPGWGHGCPGSGVHRLHRCLLP